VSRFIYCCAECHHDECRYAECRGASQGAKACYLSVTVKKKFFKLDPGHPGADDVPPVQVDPQHRPGRAHQEGNADSSQTVAGTGQKIFIKLGCFGLSF